MRMRQINKMAQLAFQAMAWIQLYVFANATQEPDVFWKFPVLSKMCWCVCYCFQCPNHLLLAPAYQQPVTSTDWEELGQENHSSFHFSEILSSRDVSGCTWERVIVLSWPACVWHLISLQKHSSTDQVPLNLSVLMEQTHWNMENTMGKYNGLGHLVQTLWNHVYAWMYVLMGPFTS